MSERGVGTPPPSTSPSHQSLVDGTKRARRLEESAAVQMLVEAGATRRSVQNKAATIYKQTVLEGENRKKLIPTDRAGAPIGNKQFLNNIITKYAGIVLDLGRVKIPKPTDECWKELSNLVEKELYYSPYPLAAEYIRDYLGKSIRDARHEWHMFYKKTKGERHPKCRLQWFLKLKEWWDSAQFRDLSNQMKYAKSCSGGGNNDAVDFTSADEEMIAQCPDFMEEEDSEGEKEASEDLTGFGEEQSQSSSVLPSNTEVRLQVLETTLREHGSALTEQGRIHKEMLRILRDLKLGEEPVPLEGLAKCMPSNTEGSHGRSGELAPSAAEHDSGAASLDYMTADDVGDNEQNCGPRLVLPRFNCDTQHLETPAKEQVGAM
jgi:hypothetical protein